MMSIAVFGKKLFRVGADSIYTLDDVQYGTGLNTEKQDAEGKKPSTYNKGPALSSLNFKLHLDASLGINPRRELEEWEAIKDAASAYQFILGSKPLGKNKWLLVDIQAGSFRIDNLGVLLAAVLTFRFDEYVRPGSAPESEASGAADYTSLLTPEEKKQQKRDNPNMPKGTIVPAGTSTVAAAGAGGNSA